jgi:HTH-type transcriptional regulator/antitoxin HigA
MIANERQYKISRQQLARLRESLDQLGAAGSEEPQTLMRAEMDALSSQIWSLSAEIAEYQALRSGATIIPLDVGLSELPHQLIRARIARGLSQRDLADHVGLKEQQIQRYESQEYASASLRRLKEIARALGLRVAGAADSPAATAEGPIEHDALDWGAFPVKEMYRRGWFQGFSGSLAEALRGAEELVHGFIETSLGGPPAALYRRKVRAGGSYDSYTLLAWQCRVLSVAAQQDVARHRGSRMDAKWFAALVKSSRHDDGPIQARDLLADAGIALVVEPHLAGTYLDGAALLARSQPVIGMTLRYDRLDHFWFVLIHELVHVKKHLRRGTVESVFDDLEAHVADQVEEEADAQAGELLIPAKVWRTAVARYTRSHAAVVALASDLGISASIVAGRIRHEASNYVILNELVGHGEVRKLFPAAPFGE